MAKGSGKEMVQVDLGSLVDTRVNTILATVLRKVADLLDAEDAESGDGDAPARKPRASKSSGKKCAEAGCDEEVRSRGLCQNHYQKMIRAEKKSKEGVAKPAAATPAEVAAVNVSGVAAAPATAPAAAPTAPVTEAPAAPAAPAPEAPAPAPVVETPAAPVV